MTEQRNAEIELRKATADVLRYKKRLQKFKACRDEMQRGVRERVYRSAVTFASRVASVSARAAFLLWRSAAQLASSQRRCDQERINDEEVGESLWSWRFVAPVDMPAERGLDRGLSLEVLLDGSCFACKRVAGQLSLAPADAERQRGTAIRRAAARPLLALLRVFRAWSTAAVCEIKLRALARTASEQSSAALSMLRSEARVIAKQKLQAATSAVEARSLLHVATYFCRWARIPLVARQGRRSRHAISHRATDASPEREASTNSLGASSAGAAVMQGLAVARGLATARRALLQLAAPLGAWAREAARANALLRFRSGDAILDSGLAAKRKQRELDELRSRASDQLKVADAEAADARAAAAAANQRNVRILKLVAQMESAAQREADLAFCYVALKAWIVSTTSASHDVALHKVHEEADCLRRAAVECVRNESKVALREAWDRATEASRRVAALERREQRPFTAAMTAMAPQRCASSSGSRPTTALAVQEKLRLADQAAEAARQQICVSRGDGSTHPPEVWVLSARGDASTRRISVIDSWLARHERCWQAIPFEAWRWVVFELHVAREIGRIQTEASDQVVAAREGRKGMLIAGIGQQVRSWTVSAFASWRCASLEARVRPRPKLPRRGPAEFPPAVRCDRQLTSREPAAAAQSSHACLLGAS